VNRPTNWIFLGDSITEGVGSLRVTFVSELVNRLRASSTARAVHDMRLREVDEESFNRYIRANLAGYLRQDKRTAAPALWVWNLGSEGRTIDADQKWLPFLENLRILRQWAGICDMTPDYSPIIGVVGEVPGFILDVGWGTYGFKAGPVSGRRIAELIATGRVPDLIAPFTIERFATDGLIGEKAAAAVSH